MDKKQELEITDALAAELGIENPGEQAAPKAASDFFKAVEEMQAEEAPGPKTETVEHEPAGTEWIHEPTGKKFETELEYLRHESGWKDSKYGPKIKELEAELTGRKAADEKPAANPATLTQEQQERNLLELALQGTGIKADDADASYGLVAKISENLIGRYDQIVGEQFKEMRAELDGFKAASSEQTALQASGLDMAKVQSTLEKHPYLNDIKDVTKRLAVIADLASKESGEKPPTNPLRDRLQPNAADHVEGSVGSVSAEEYDSNVEDKFMEMSDSDRMATLGKMLESSELGQSIKDSHI